MHRRGKAVSIIGMTKGTADKAKQPNKGKLSLEDYLLERKIQELYDQNKPKSDDTPKYIKIALGKFSQAKKQAARLKKIKLKRVKVTPKRAITSLVVVGLAVPVVAVVVAQSITHSHKQPDTLVSGVLGEQQLKSNNTSTSVPINQSPVFQTLLPEGKSAKDVGGFAKVNAAGSAPAYTFVDKIGPVEVQVTQQQLPDNFKQNTSAEVEKMAISFNATQAIKTSTVEYYVGTSTQGPQSVITYRKNLLIFIKSSGKISNDIWTRYITDLQ